MERGQAHTLEAFTAALLVVAGVTFALEATAVTPLSASTSNQHIQNQQRLVAEDLLAATASNGSLRDAVVHWNASTNGFPQTGDAGHYVSGGPPNAFGRALNDTFRDGRIAFNVYVSYWSENNQARETMVYMGSPSDNAVTASRSVTLYNGTQLTGPGTGNVSTAAENDGFYAPDIAPGNELFNVLEVRIVVWRM